ncbi:UvrB/UvrC motif-containing protein [Salinicoccus carnicancri]|uniref:UvrB/UvrC motif-containing protein n=1 Tax=Salinicoccus carnicancri TaxID=558170 RepID=UPI0002F57896|nr:UvrB/UvrC motif-containing protein [Salinicoccus carnicancri]
MKCESCNVREATIHITKGSGLDKSEKFLCEQCANASFESDFSYPDDSFNIHQLLKSLSQQKTTQQKERKRKECETCGSTIDSIVKNGKFGCPDCYSTFDRQAPEIITRVQAHQTEHIGKVPKKARSQIKVKKQIETLRQKLSELIESQEFEEAAVVRDEIRELEKAGGMDGAK